MKDYIGCSEEYAPKDLSTNVNAKEEIHTGTVWRKPSAKIAGKGRILGDIMTPVVDTEDWRHWHDFTGYPYLVVK
jgi:hypothetical protein